MVIEKDQTLPEGFMLGRKSPNDETKLKISNSKKDRICITNGIVNRYISKEETISEGFYHGMKKRV